MPKGPRDHLGLSLEMHCQPYQEPAPEPVGEGLGILYF